MITIDMHRSLTSFCDQQTCCTRCEFNGYNPCPVRLILIIGDAQKVIA
jgi:hypothetical protein